MLADTARPGPIADLPDAGLRTVEEDGIVWIVQDAEGVTARDVERLRGLPGIPGDLSLREGALTHVADSAASFAHLLDARARRPSMPARAVLEAGVLLADALEGAWGDGTTPPPVRPDPRSAALGLSEDGALRILAVRVAGRAPRDAGDGRGPVAHDDSRAEDLYLLGSVLYEMATRRRFGRPAQTETVHRHHVQRRMAAADFSVFGPVRDEYVALIRRLVAFDRDPATPFRSIAAACRELLLRVEGDGLEGWARVLFHEEAHSLPPDELSDAPDPVALVDVPPLPRVPPVPAALRLGPTAGDDGADAPEERTPLVPEGIEDRTDLPLRIRGVGPVEDHTEVSSEATPAEETPAVPVSFARPTPLVLPPPSFELPSNVIPLHSDAARPGMRRGGLVPRSPDPVAAPSGGMLPAASRPRSPDDPGRGSHGSPRRRGMWLAVAAGTLLGLLVAVMGGWWMRMSLQGGVPPEVVDLQPSAAQPDAPAPVLEPVPPAPEPEVAAVAVAPPAVEATPTEQALATPESPRKPRATEPAPTPRIAAPAKPPPVPVDDPWSAPPAATGPVMVSLNSEPSGLLVSVDGQPRGSTPLQLLLTPGGHTLSYNFDGSVVAREVTVGGPTSRNTWTYYVGQGRIE